MSVSKYHAAIVDPFHESAKGAQVPDEWAFPTETACLRKSFTVFSTNSSGNVDLVVQPNPICTVAAQQQYVSGTTWYNTVTGGSVWTATGNTTALPTGGTGSGTNGFTEMGLSTYASLGNTFNRYRMVSYGVRVYPTTSATNTTGTAYFAKVPSLDQFGNYAQGTTSGFTTNAASWNDYLSYYGLPPVDASGFIGTGLMQLQAVHETSIPEMTLDGGVEVVNTVCSPLAFGWRDGIRQADLTTAGSGLKQGLIQTNSTLVTQNVQDVDFLDQGGCSVILLRMSGLPSGTPSAPVACFTVDVIMHLEGVPNLAGSVLAGGQTPPVAPHMIQHVIAKASRHPHFRKARRFFRDLGRGIDRTFGHGTSKSLIDAAMVGAMM